MVRILDVPVVERVVFTRSAVSDGAWVNVIAFWGKMKLKLMLNT
jgi:hypothetical protein